MSEEVKSQQNKSEEINLLELSRRMGSAIGKGIRKGMNALGKATLISIVFLLRRWVWLALSVAIGVGISYALKMETGKIYSSELTLRSNAVPNSDMITYINRLHSICRAGNRTALRAALSISPEEVMLIRDIQAFWAIDILNDGIPDLIDYKNEYNNDTVNKKMSDRFVVRAKTRDPQEFSALGDKILGYVRQNPLFQQKNQVRLVQNKEIQVRLIYDIDQLDSLQKIKYFEETRKEIVPSGGQMVFLQEKNTPTELIYDNIYLLYSRKQVIDTDLELYKDVVTLLNDFTQPNKPINGTLFYAKGIVPELFILCLLILILIDNRKKLQEIYRKY